MVTTKKLNITFHEDSAKSVIFTKKELALMQQILRGTCIPMGTVTMRKSIDRKLTMILEGFKK